VSLFLPHPVLQVIALSSDALSVVVDSRRKAVATTKTKLK